VLTIHPAETNITAAFPRHEITSICSPSRLRKPLQLGKSVRQDVPIRFPRKVAKFAMKVTKPGCSGGTLAVAG
jgi:hypothetical protein